MTSRVYYGILSVPCPYSMLPGRGRLIRTRPTGIHRQFSMISVISGDFQVICSGTEPDGSRLPTPFACPGRSATEVHSQDHCTPSCSPDEPCRALDVDVRLMSDVHRCACNLITGNVVGIHGHCYLNFMGLGGYHGSVSLTKQESFRPQARSAQGPFSILEF